MFKKSLRAAGAAVAAALVVAAAPSASAASVATNRISGVDRYDTSALVSARTFTSGVPVAFVATGENYPDALAAGAAAAKAGGPVLLVRPKEIPTQVVSELERLKPKRIVVVGGFPTVSEAVSTSLVKYATSGVVTRYASVDRYGTAGALMKGEFGAYTGTVFVATGENFPDGLAATAAAASVGAPLVLSAKDAVPSATSAALRTIKPSKFIVLGGENTLSPAVEAELKEMAPVTRVSGADRYDTAAKLASLMFKTQSENVYIVTGNNYPDALTAGAAAAKSGSPLFLSPGTCLPESTQVEVQATNPKMAIIVGGSNQVAEAAVTTAC